MSTLAEMEARYDVSHLDHLDKEASVPVVSGIAMQGDVAIIRRANIAPGVDPIPSTGHPVVRGENGSNTHALFGPGFFTPARAVGADQTLGILTVPDGRQVLLSHPEHGGLLIAPGTYVLRRQRQQADVIALVAD